MASDCVVRSRQPLTPRALAARFLRARSGSTTLEFAIIIGPLLYMILAIFEIAMTFWTGNVLEQAVAGASRQIYTGQFQSDPANANLTTAQKLAKFTSSLCGQIGALINCSDIAVDVRSADSFAGNPSTPVNNGVYDTSGYTYQDVPDKTIGIITVSMQYQPVFKTFLPAPGGLSNGPRLLIATTTFRTEPYKS